MILETYAVINCNIQGLAWKYVNGEKAEELFGTSWTCADIPKINFLRVIATVCIFMGFFSV